MSFPIRRPRRLCVFPNAAWVFAVLAGGCLSSGPARAPLQVWAHTGRPAERRELEHCAAKYQETHPGRPLALTFLPDGTYNAQVQAAALAGQLPDLLEFDGPFVHSYVWGGHLRPVERVRGVERLLPSLRAQGTSGDHLYSVGLFDSGLALFVRRSALPAGWRVPEHPREAWAADEFTRLLELLAAQDPDGKVLDLKLNYRGEWLTYGFSPALQSAGADLVSRQGTPYATGLLDSAASVRALSLLQDWRQRFADPNLDDGAFSERRVAVSWVGHWEYPRYSACFGPDLAVVPLPDFGQGSRTGQGSWNWGITRACQDVERAEGFLEFLLEDGQVLAISGASGGVPGTVSALARSPLYGPQGPLRLFSVQLLEGIARPRPLTAAYPVVTSVFQETLDDIFRGVPVAPALRRAAVAIDRDVADNRGYRAP